MPSINKLRDLLLGLVRVRSVPQLVAVKSFSFMLTTVEERTWGNKNIRIYGDASSHPLSDKTGMSNCSSSHPQ